MYRAFVATGAAYDSWNLSLLRYIIITKFWKLTTDKKCNI